MITIDESNTVHCPHCTAELSAYEFDDFTDEAINEMGLCEGHTICPKCNGPLYVEVNTHITAKITVKKN